MSTTLVSTKCGSCANPTLNPSGYCHHHEASPAAARPPVRYAPPPPSGLVDAPSPERLSGVVNCFKCVTRRTRHVSGLCHADRSTASVGELARATSATARSYPELLPMAAKPEPAARPSWWRRSLGAG